MLNRTKDLLINNVNNEVFLNPFHLKNYNAFFYPSREHFSGVTKYNILSADANLFQSTYPTIV